MKHVGVLVSGLLLLAIGAPSPAAGVTLFSGTGQGILNDPDIVFPTRPPALAGTSILFESGTVFGEQLFVLPLFAAGTFSAGSPAVDISVSITVTRRTRTIDFPLDNDFYLHVGDGSASVFFLAQDNIFFAGDGEGTGNAGDATLAATTFANQSLERLFVDAGYPPVGGSFTVTADFTLDASSSSVSGAFGTGSGSNTISLAALDRSQELSFIFGADNERERYQVDSLTITSSVPEPSVLALTLTGIAAVLGRRRR